MKDFKILLHGGVNVVKPLVSVGLPTHNNPEGLERVLNNLVTQSYKNIEIIISLNPSVNEDVNVKCHEIIERFRFQDTRIKRHYQVSNIGGTPNFWFVLHEAPIMGKYFMFAQDDDAWSTYFIERLVYLLELDPTVPVAISSVERHDENGDVFDFYDMRGLSVLNAMRDDRLSFLWMGIWRLEKIRDYSRVWSDIAMSAQALLDGGVLVNDEETYVKGLRHDKAREQVSTDPLWFFRIYYYLLKGVALRGKGVLPLVAVTNLVWVFKSYAAQVLFLLPVDHPIRKIVRSNKNG
jgi:glycosyltransferase involved in cell wall biosynthesis